MRLLFALLGACAVAPVTAAPVPEVKFTLLFVSNRTGNPEIYLLNADGSSPVNLTRSSAFNSYPAWSPSCRKIAFTSDRMGSLQIFVMDPDGTHVVQLTHGTEPSRC